MQQQPARADLLEAELGVQFPAGVQWGGLTAGIERQRLALQQGPEQLGAAQGGPLPQAAADR